MPEPITTLQNRIKKARPSLDPEWFDLCGAEEHTGGIETACFPFYIAEDRGPGYSRLGTWSVWVSDRSAYGATVLYGGLSSISQAAERMADCVRAYEAVRPVHQVYFICSPSQPGSPIKIGFTTDLKKRLKSLQTGSPNKLEVLAVVAACVTQERAYHERFAAHRLNGEWFDPHPDILAEIARLTPTYIDEEN